MQSKKEGRTARVVLISVAGLIAGLLAYTTFRETSIRKEQTKISAVHERDQEERLIALKLEVKTLQTKLDKLHTEYATSKTSSFGKLDGVKRLEDRIAYFEQVDPCLNAREGLELWGNVIHQGRTKSNPRGLWFPTAVECCRACYSEKGCNQWVWGHKGEGFGQCWLKREGSKAQISTGPSNPAWTSGYIPRYFDVSPADLPPVNTSISKLVLTTQFGVIRIKLRPDWHESSVEYLRRLAMNPELCGAECQFYRAEPGFLLQGSLRSFLPANEKTQEGPGIMQTGDIGWAGGGPGPDWFIYTDTNPATGWGKSHTVWGQLVDAASMDVVHKILEQPASSNPPGGMKYLHDRVSFTVSGE